MAEESLYPRFRSYSVCQQMFTAHVTAVHQTVPWQKIKHAEQLYNRSSRIKSTHLYRRQLWCGVGLSRRFSTNIPEPLRPKKGVKAPRFLNHEQNFGAMAFGRDAQRKTRRKKRIERKWKEAEVRRDEMRHQNALAINCAFECSFNRSMVVLTAALKHARYKV